MDIQIKAFSYWKTEHRDAEHCQDAYAVDPARGLFVIADGAGTTLYPAIWARQVSAQFLAVPLMSDDPFEIEWWVRQAQDEYHQKIAALPTPTAWNAVQKSLKEGSATTLAALRVFSAIPETAQAQLLVFGDSCVITRQERGGSGNIRSFVLQRPEEFERGPICLPSELRLFQRSFHICRLQSMEFQEGDSALLATDAVAKWIIGRGDGAYGSIEEAFARVCQQETEESWRQFIDECRCNKSMVDDDATVIILTFKAESDRIEENSSRLGTTNEHGREYRLTRKEAFEKARALQNKELMALSYGDGRDFVELDQQPDKTLIENARQVADALREVLTTLQQVKNAPDFRERINRVWQKHRELLLHEPCAENLRETLRNRGIALEPVPLLPAPVSVEAESPAQSSAENQKMRLENGLLRALHKDRDLDIAEAYKAIQRSGVPIKQFEIVAEEPERIQQALRFQDALEELRRALASRRLGEIGRSSAYNTRLLEGAGLSEDEQRWVKLAWDFVDAICKQDSEAAGKIALEIEQAQVFDLIETEKRVIRLFHEHRRSYEDLEEVLHRPSLPDEMIEAAMKAEEVYREVMNAQFELSRLYQNKALPSGGSQQSWEYTLLSRQEMEQIELAKYFVEARKNGDDDKIARLYERMTRSRYRDLFAFSIDDYQRINARSQRQVVTAPTQILVQVNEKKIDSDQFRNFYLVQREYSRYLQSALELPAYRENKLWIEEQINGIQSAREDERSPEDVLDQLINHVFIMEKIQSLTQKAGVARKHFEIEQALKQASEIFQTLAGETYDSFLRKYALKDLDVRRALEIIQYAICFTRHAEQWIERTDPRRWLQRQRVKKPLGKGPVVLLGPDHADRQRYQAWLRSFLPQE